MTFLTAIENVSADLTTAELRDLSQYGGSNPNRSQLALYVYLYKRDAQNNDTAISISNTIPLTANSWSFALPLPDGVFVAIVFGFYIWSAGTYPSGTARYYNGSYYLANTSTSSVPGADGTWTLITDVRGQVTGNITVEQTQTYNWSAAHSQSGKLGDALADFGPSVINGKCRDLVKVLNVLTPAGLIESAFTNFRAGDYQTAQSTIDYIQNNYAA